MSPFDALPPRLRDAAKNLEKAAMDRTPAFSEAGIRELRGVKLYAKEGSSLRPWSELPHSVREYWMEAAVA